MTPHYSDPLCWLIVAHLGGGMAFLIRWPRRLGLVGLVVWLVTAVLVGVLLMTGVVR